LLQQFNLQPKNYITLKLHYHHQTQKSRIKKQQQQAPPPAAKNKTTQIGEQINSTIDVELK